MRVLVWAENCESIYPDGVHGAIASTLSEDLPQVRAATATLEDPGCGLDDSVLEQTDVLVWWAHVRNEEVPDDVAQRVYERVLRGMGLIVLHSGGEAKVFRRLMGTSCTWGWREPGERELIWTVCPSHPIAQDVGDVIELTEHQMYGEYFDIPRPDDLVFISSSPGGEVFRSGCTFTRGNGRIFYFSAGHETLPIFHHPQIRKVMANAVTWAYPVNGFVKARGFRRMDPV